jgi:hypothetical protein
MIYTVRKILNLKGFPQICTFPICEHVAPLTAPVSACAWHIFTLIFSEDVVKCSLSFISPLRFYVHTVKIKLYFLVFFCECFLPARELAALVAADAGVSAAVLLVVLPQGQAVGLAAAQSAPAATVAAAVGAACRQNGLKWDDVAKRSNVWIACQR